MILTANEKKLIRFLASGLKDHSINEIARACKIAPNGAHKILRKLEEENVVTPKQIANIKSYQLDFSSEKTLCILELALMPEKLEGRVKQRADDLKRLRGLAKAAIIFGSYTKKKEPKDLDVIFVLESRNFSRYKRLLAEIQGIVPVKIHDVAQKNEDFSRNLQKDDPIISEALRNGIVLWGFSTIAQLVKNASGQAQEMP